MSRVGPVLIIGTGLVGASVGLALTKAGEQVHLRDRVSSHAVVAAGLGAGVLAEPDADSVRLVIVAVPPDAIAAVVAEALDAYPHAVVSDVGSVKSAISHALAGLDTTRYVGSHPMAGSQLSGPLTAVADLFVDRTWVVTPNDASSPDAVATVEELASICGARVLRMPANEHDEAVAQVSHLPQLMSSLTAGHLRDVPASNLRLAGPGVRDVTRIAGSDPVLWRQVISANREAIRRELEGVRRDLDELLATLDDPDAVQAFIARGRAGAHALPGKHGSQPKDFASVVIEIPDAPGALARLFTDIGETGLNVEDMSIEHDQARQVGYLCVAVVPEKAAALRTAMLDHGWTLRAWEG